MKRCMHPGCRELAEEGQMYCLDHTEGSILEWRAARAGQAAEEDACFETEAEEESEGEAGD